MGRLIFDGLGQVMIVVPSRKDYLGIPGGYIVHGGTPSRAGAVYLEKDHAIELFSRIFQRIRSQALDPGESVKRMQRIRSERYEG